MKKLLALVLLLTVVAVPSGAATTLPSLIVRVNVALRPSAVTLSVKQVRRGNYVEFKVRNTTPNQRKFMLRAARSPCRPRNYRLLVISFDVRGSTATSAGVVRHGFDGIFVVS